VSEPRSYFLGIDPGKDGGLAMVDGEEGLYQGHLWKTPLISGERDEYDVSRMRWILGSAQDQVRMEFHATTLTAIVEKQQTFPKQGGVSNFSTGYGLGLWIGLLTGIGIPLQIVPPRTWQKQMLSGTRRKDPKQGSILVAQRLWPKVDFRRSSKAVKPDHGLTDAALMATFGRLSFRLIREVMAGARP